jgi:IS1 family transposase
VDGRRCRRTARADAQALWDSLPEAYHESATCYTDYWEAYSLTFPEERHVATGKDSGFTNHIGAIWLFVRHYNSSRLDFP